MNTRQKKKRMNLFLKRRGIPGAMNIREIAPVVHILINKMYQVYRADRTRDNRKQRLAIIERKMAELYRPCHIIDNSQYTPEVVRGHRLTSVESDLLAIQDHYYEYDEHLDVKPLNEITKKAVMKYEHENQKET